MKKQTISQSFNEHIADRDFIPHLASAFGCDHIEKTRMNLTAGGRKYALGCLKEADYNNPSEHYRQFFIAKNGDFIPTDGYDRLIVVSSLDCNEIYVQLGGSRERQKLVDVTGLVRIIGHLAATGEVVL